MTLTPDLSRAFTSTGDARVTDAELMARLVADDLRALAEVYRRHAGRVIAVANAVLRDPAAAEDVCQDVFVALSRRPQGFDSERGSLGTYLALLAHGRALDRLRSEQARARRQQHHASLGPAASQDPGDQAVSSAMATLIWTAVSALPVHEAEALRLAYFGDTTYREVARLLGVAEGTVKSRIRNGLRRLRTSFIEQGIIRAA